MYLIVGVIVTDYFNVPKKYVIKAFTSVIDKRKCVSIKLYLFLVTILRISFVTSKPLRGVERVGAYSMNNLIPKYRT